VSEGGLAGGDRQVAPQRVELGGRTRRIGGLEPVLELVGVQAPGDGVLVELIDEALAVLVGGAEGARDRVCGRR
jgi:hypothetical protein